MQHDHSLPQEQKLIEAVNHFLKADDKAKRSRGNAFAVMERSKAYTALFILFRKKEIQS